MAGCTYVKSLLFEILKCLTSTIQSKGKAWQYGQFFSVGQQLYHAKMHLFAHHRLSTYLQSVLMNSITDEQQVSNSSNRPMCMFQSEKKGFHYAGD